MKRQSHMASADPFVRPLAELTDDAFLQLDADTPYGEALERLRAAHAGSVIVTRSGKVAGVFTERDVLNKALLERTPAATPLSKLMTPDPAVLSLKATVREAVALMDARRIRNVPLVDEGGKPLALLTVGHVIRFLADAFPAEVVNLPPRPGQVTEEVEGA